MSRRPIPRSATCRKNWIPVAQSVVWCVEELRPAGESMASNFRLRGVFRGLFPLLVGVCLLLSTGAPSPAAEDGAARAPRRYALVIGVGDYDPAKSGLKKLESPATDAERMRDVLERPDVGFAVTLLRNQDVKDKAIFDQKLQEFTAQLEKGSVVLFYFSGHGFNYGSKGNLYLLSSVQRELQFVKDRPGPSGETTDDIDKRYLDWLADTQVLESSVLNAFKKTDPSLLILIADACRDLVSEGSKSDSAPSSRFPIKAKGLIAPQAKDIPTNVLLMYAAGKNETASDDLVDDPAQSNASLRSDKEAAGASNGTGRQKLSAFTGVLLRYIRQPYDINSLTTAVIADVRDKAADAGKKQIPDIRLPPTRIAFQFYQGVPADVIAARCRTAAAEVQEFVYGITLGAVSQRDLERKRIELAPCGPKFADDLNRLYNSLLQGAGTRSTRATAFANSLPKSGDPEQICDYLASSPLDLNRAQGSGKEDIQSIAVKSLSGAADGEKKQVRGLVEQSVKSCEAAVAIRPLAARLKYNLGRSYYAEATTLPQGEDRDRKLQKASKALQDASDAGYAAAFNAVAQLYLALEYYDIVDGHPVQRPVDEAKTREYLERGASLGDVVALYNLGLAHQNGALGLSSGETFAKTQTTAFKFLSQSAENGYVPAIIETAKALYCGDRCGITRDEKRAIELLELAASKGSWDAMHYLGEVTSTRNDTTQAIVWYARAAEGGESRSQAQLASLLTLGNGLPSSQPEAAARYWRLSAASGNTDAQVKLAELLRDGKVPFRPTPATLKHDGNGKPDGGALEILQLYSSAFARGNPQAGLELGILYRAGFPAGGSEAIPKNPELAVSLLWKTMDNVRQADPDSAFAKPDPAILAAFELTKMVDAGEAKRGDGSSLLTQDQVDQLHADYGDPSKLLYIRVKSITHDAKNSIVCKGADKRDRNLDPWVWIWNRKSSEPPTEQQFNWLERYYQCKQRPADDKTKDQDLGITKKVRSVVNKEFAASVKLEKTEDGAKSKPPKPFVDRMVEIITKKSRSSDDDD